MADRLADNRGLPYNPNKELWGQGLVQLIVPLRAAYGASVPVKIASKLPPGSRAGWSRQSEQLYCETIATKHLQTLTQ